MKKTNNKGFSLVELIVVVAIMAVLMVVLAPSLLGYVEESRLQRDNSALSEVANAIEIAMTDEDIIRTFPAAGEDVMVVTGGTPFNFPNAAGGGTALQAELAETIDEVDLTSRTYNGQALTMHVEVDAGAVIVTVSDWADEPDTLAGVAHEF